jgi:hypothetical protein
MGSILYRVHRGKPILRPELPQLRFVETWCSGRSNRSVLASLVGAQRFLWVAVTKDTLYVSPHVPFNLIFLAEAFGWDHRVPGSTILDARQSAQDSRESRVLIKYRHKTGDEEIFELSVRDPRFHHCVARDTRSLGVKMRVLLDNEAWQR